jgi:integrase
VALTLDHLQQREEHWAIVDRVGNGGHIRTVPVPDWVTTELEDWLRAAAIDRGKLFRRVNKVGRTWGYGMTVKAVWHIVKESARNIGVARLAPHDLRRSALPRIGRRVGADSISFGARFSADDQTLPWLQAADSFSRQRSHWHRAEPANSKPATYVPFGGLRDAGDLFVVHIPAL